MVVLANHWHREGHEVHFWVIKDGGPRRMELSTGIPVTVLETGFQGLQRVLLVYQIKTLVHKNRPQLIFSTLTYANCLMAQACKNIPTPPILILREANTLQNLQKSGRWRWWFTRRWIRKTYSRAQWIVANSQVAVDEFSQLLPKAAQERTLYLPNPVELEPESGEIRCRRPERNIFRILACGRLIYQKGFDLLIEALGNVREIDGWELVVLGEGPLHNELLSQANRCGIADRCTFPGFVKNVREWMRGSDLIVIPSRWEGFPNVLVEAIECGVNVLATRCPGANEQILGEFTSSLIPVEDVVALTEKLRYHISELPEFPQALRVRVREQYSTSKISKKILSLCES